MNKNRALIMFVSLIAVFGILTARLAYLASGTGLNETVRAMSAQYTKTYKLASRRGFIYDRNGVPLAGIPDGYLTVVDPTQDGGDGGGELNALSEASGLSSEEIKNKLAGQNLFTLNSAVKLDSGYAYSIPLYKRYIPTAEHIIGYVGADGTGVSGVEKAYDYLLKETSGSISVSYQADAQSKLFGGLPVIFCDQCYSSAGGVYLTLESGLQNLVESLDIKRGAVVVADCASGEILACASFPRYSPDSVADYLESDNGELINRAFASFTPGSIFKLVTASAALENDSYSMMLTYNCDGKHCYGGISHGSVDMKNAFAQSCNEYFAAVGESIGKKKLADTAAVLGIGEENQLGLLDCWHGVVDTSVMSNAAIGQGGTLVTPIEVTRIICTIMNGGYSRRLSLVGSVVTSGGEVIKMENDEKTAVLKSGTVEILRDFLRSVVTSGTGKKAVPENAAKLGIVSVGGKTASAQSGQYADYDGDGKKTELIHSWFTGYAEFEGGDTYAVTVLLEGASSGSTTVFSEVLSMISQRRAAF